jgi:2,3-bisphosphoglycerate-dependent phosphoglycerate mutase
MVPHKESRLVLLRHGESLWNQENRFTGWVDVDLSSKGESEAKDAGRVLKEKAYQFDWTYTSLLKRSIRTHWLALEGMDRLWSPVTRSWRLNERHYGALQGLDKAETAAKHGEDQVKIWRRSFDTPPPLLDSAHKDHPSNDPRYRGISEALLPRGESLKDTVARVIPFLNEELGPRLRSGQSLLVVAHGNSIRALIQYLENLSPEQIMEVNVPTGIPLEFKLTFDLKVAEKTYLGEANRVEAALNTAAGQGKAKK